MSEYETTLMFNSVNKKQRLRKLTKEEKVLKLIKGGFESIHDMTIEEFFNIYRCFLENNPEKLL